MTSEEVAEFLTISQAAQRSGVAPRTLYGWLERGLIVPRREPGGQIRVLLRDVLALANRRSATESLQLPAHPVLQARSLPQACAPSIAQYLPTALASPEFPSQAEAQVPASHTQPQTVPARPDDALEQARRSVELLRIHAEEQRVLASLESESLARAQAAQAQDEALAEAKAHQVRRQEEHRVATARAQIELEQQQLELRLRAADAERQEREQQAAARQKAQRQRWLDAWEARQMSEVERLHGAEAAATARDAVRHVLEHYGPDSDEHHVETVVRVEVARVLAPIHEQEQKRKLESARRDLVEAVLEAKRLRPDAALREAARRAAESAAGVVDPRAKDARRRVEAAVDQVTQEDARVQEAERERKARNCAKRKALGDVPTLAARWLGEGATQAECQEAEQRLRCFIEANDSADVDARLRRSGEGLMADLALELRRRSTVDYILASSLAPKGGDRQHLRNVLVAAVAQAHPGRLVDAAWHAFQMECDRVRREAAKEKERRA